MIPPELLAEPVRPGAIPEDSTGGNQPVEDTTDDEDEDKPAKTGAASMADGDNPSEVVEAIADTFDFT